MKLFHGAVRALTISGFAVVLPLGASAQTPAQTPPPTQPEIIWACYVPTSGTMYRIKVADTKDSCVGQAIAFSWNAQGLKGDTGEKGDKGDTGPQGPAGPAGTGGGSGFTLPYSASFSSTGNLFNLTNTDGGGVAGFSAGGSQNVLNVNYSGTSSVNAINATSSSGVAALRAANSGTGVALRAENTSSTNTNNALNAVNNGPGNGLFVQSFLGSGAFIQAATRGLGIVAGTGNGLDVQTGGNFGVNVSVNNPNGNSAIFATSNARFSTADFRATGPLSSSTALYAESQSANAAGFRTLGGDANTNAVFIANDGPGFGLNVNSKGVNSTMNVRNGGAGAAGNFSSANQFNSAFFENTGSGGGLFAKSGGDAGTIGAQNTGTNGAAANFTSAGTWATVNANNSNANSPNGFAYWGESRGTSHTASFRNFGTGGALNLESATTTASTLNINHTGGGGGVGAIWASSSAQNTAVFVNTGTGNNIAVVGKSQGVWPAAQFENPGSVALRTFGSADINGTATVNGNATINGNFQVNGTKNAIVPTSSGMTKVYSEESTELWFTDYGEAKLVDGVAVIAIDAKFAETIDLTEKYHVFVQANDDATLYVATRTAQGFEIRVRDGARDASFSYRLVAKRKGYAKERLAPADRN